MSDAFLVSFFTNMTFEYVSIQVLYQLAGGLLPVLKGSLTLLISHFYIL